MRRREFIATTAATAAGLMLGRKASAGNKQGRPNILFIMTDQQHAGMMSCTGNQWLKTPAMDRQTSFLVISYKMLLHLLQLHCIHDVAGDYPLALPYGLPIHPFPYRQVAYTH